MQTRHVTLALSALALATASFAANADILFSNLGVNAPPAMVGPHAVTSFDLTPQTNIADFTLVNSIPGNPYPGTLGIAPSITKFPFSAYNGTWGHGYSGPLYADSAYPSTTVYTLTLPPNTRAFYFYATSRGFGTTNITATSDSGSTSGPISVTTYNLGGPDSANGFAFYSTAGENIASITINGGALGVILGEFGIGTGPVQPVTTCASEGYTGTKLTWCRNICEMGYTGATLDMWIHRWINRYRDLPYCAVEGEPEPPPQEQPPT